MSFGNFPNDPGMSSGLAAWSVPVPSPNGSDDTAAILAVQNNVRTMGILGARLSFQHGVYWVRGSQIKQGTGEHIDGEGIGNTIIRQLPGQNGDVITNLDATNGNTGVQLTNITIDGNKAAQGGTQSHFAVHYIRCSGGMVDRVETMNADGHGFTLDGQGVVTKGFKVSNVVTHDNSQTGHWETFAMRNVQTTNLEAYNNGNHGVEFDSSEERATNIDSHNNTGRGIFIRNVFGCVHTNLSASQNGQDGIYVQGWVSSAGSNWNAYSNSTSSAGTYHEINFSGDNTLSYGITSGSVLDGCNFGPAGGLGNTAGYALFVGDPTAGNFGDLKVTGAFLTAGLTGSIRTPANIGGVVIQDFPGGAQNWRLWQGNLVIANGNLDLKLAGKGLMVAEGANAKQGLTAAMVAGTLTVANTSVTATSRIIATRQDGGTNAGAVFVSARVVGTSFTVTSTNALDTGQVAFQIFEPG